MSDTPSAWALTAARPVLGELDEWFTPDAKRRLLAHALDAARADGRRQGIEEAARVCDERDYEPDLERVVNRRDWDRDRMNRLETCCDAVIAGTTRAIRALLDAPGGETP